MKLLLIAIITLTINVPIFEGATVVTGTAPPGETVTLQVIQDPAQVYVMQASDDGAFQFNLSAPLDMGYVVQVTGGGAVDYALVESPVARWYFPVVMR